MLTLSSRTHDDGVHAQGPVDAPLTIVEFGDYVSPECGRAHAIVKALQTRFWQHLRFVYRNFPLGSAHPQAQAAAEAAEAAGAQGRFWSMHDLLFEHQQTLDASSLRHHARRLRLDVARWQREWSEHLFSDRVARDIETGLRHGVSTVPAFFINGQRHEGPLDEATLAWSLESAAAL